MRLKELRGLPVIDPTTARKIGSVLDYQVDPAAGRLAALDVTGTAAGATQRVVATGVKRVGRSAVILIPGWYVAGISTDIDERWLDTSTLTGLEVMRDDGTRVGRLMDAVFNQDNLKIEVYLLRANPWQRLTRQRVRIEPATVSSCSRELMMLAASTAPGVNPPIARDASILATRMPLKPEDRVPAAPFEQVPDGQTVGTQST